MINTKEAYRWEDNYIMSYLESVIQRQEVVMQYMHDVPRVEPVEYQNLPVYQPSVCTKQPMCSRRGNISVVEVLSTVVRHC